ncbi:MAG TPA: DUF1080 domain-containing protein, partial [Fodinibius sp.]|nr:DUF1080 domain-containing protein [Fodinibius sp.]
MKLLPVLSLSLVMLMTSSCTSQAQHNELTDEEENEGWTLLFDGESTDRWRGYNKDAFPEKGWTVEEGLLVVLADGGGGDIITKEKYGDFVLKMEWKAAEGANGGIFYRAMEQPSQPIYWSAPEVQILDNENHPDADQGENGNRK